MLGNGIYLTSVLFFLPSDPLPHLRIVGSGIPYPCVYYCCFSYRVTLYHMYLRGREWTAYQCSPVCMLLLFFLNGWPFTTRIRNSLLGHSDPQVIVPMAMDIGLWSAVKLLFMVAFLLFRRYNVWHGYWWLSGVTLIKFLMSLKNMWLLSNYKSHVFILPL